MPNINVLKQKVQKAEATKEGDEIVNKISGLPSSAKVRVYKIKDGTTKSFITSIPVEDFPEEPHEFIAKTFKPKHGGGDYVIEFVSSDNEVVSKGVVSVVDDAGDGEKGVSTKIIQEALDIKGEAVDEKLEAGKLMIETERARIDTLLSSINKQWDTISQLYQKQINELKDTAATTPDIIAKFETQRSIDNLQSNLSRLKESIDDAVEKSKEKSTSSQVYTLVDTMLKSILDSSKAKEDEFRAKDPVRSTTEAISAIVSTMEKLRPHEDKKDFFTELIENPERLKIFKTLTGMVSAEDVTKMVPQTPPPQKDFLEQMIEMSVKLGEAGPVLKRMLGIESQPIKSFAELLGTLVSNIGPHFVSAVKQITDNILLTKMIDKGLVKDGEVILKKQFGVASYSGQNEASKIPNEASKIPLDKSTTNNVKIEPTVAEVSLEKEFENTVIDVATGITEPTEGDVFVEKMINAVLDKLNRNPQMLIAVLKLKDVSEINDMMAPILSRIVGLDEQQARLASGAIVSGVKARI